MRNRGWLYDGKDYFTIYDFVKAHHLFSDPEWDGEPVEDVKDAGRTARNAKPAVVKEKPVEYEST